MKLVIAVDGDLLVSANSGQGMQEQMDAIVLITDQMGELVASGHKLVLTHGNAPQVGFMLLRGEAARHIVHSLPLDICGADTQGATGYMLQQALKNWLSHRSLPTEVSTVVTQVIVGETAPVGAPCTKGIGPFFDRDRAQSVKIKRGWELDLVQGQGYQRVVPCMTPKEIIEANSIRFLLEHDVVVICAGGGGIPVRVDEQGELRGVEAVVDKAYTAALLAKVIGIDTIVFVTPWEKIVSVFDLKLDNPLTQFDRGEFELLIELNKEMEDTMLHKLIASRNFLQDGGRSVLIIPPDQLNRVPEKCSGIRLCLDKLESLPG